MKDLFAKDMFQIILRTLTNIYSDRKKCTDFGQAVYLIIYFTLLPHYISYV